MFHKRLGRSVKVSALTDFEFRVWTQYELSADDFGVMRRSAIALQADNDNLAGRSATTILRALKQLVDVGLIVTFDHQAMAYVCQLDWQDFQKIAWPAKTIQPIPPDDVLERCTLATQGLFLIHPGGKKLPGKKPESPDESTSEVLPPTREGLTLAAIGKRLTAQTSEGSLRETDPPMDRWLLQLQAEYPSNRVTRGFMTSSLFFEQLSKGPESVPERWALMLRNLANQKAGHEWRVKGMIPGLEKWLRDGLWLNEHPAEAPVAEQLGARVNRTLSAAAAIMREPD